MKLLEIKNLHARVIYSDKQILRGLTLSVNGGEIHAIMGPNGAGKSTLAKILAGHPSYEITEGEIWFKGQNLLEMEPEERAHIGLFMSFQYPIEIPGLSNQSVLHIAFNAKRKAEGLPEMPIEEFEHYLNEKMSLMEIKAEFKERNLNEGFSGGEKKRNEILQMAVIDPQLAILDETDSGLDIDAMKTVARGVNKLINSDEGTKKDRGLILITHYQRLLDYIKPHHVHVMLDGRIVQSGGPELALKLEEQGYDWVISSACAGEKS